jgi:hypothetical protein
MATGALIPSELTVVGIAKQTVIGTGVAATSFFRNTDVKPQPNVPYLPDNSFQGDMAKVHDLIQGPTSTSLELSGNLYADEIGWALASLLGDVATTGTQDPFSTTFALLNSSQGQTKSYTITDWNGSTGRQYIDCKCNELSLAYTADGLVTVDSKWDGISYTSTTQPTSSFGATHALPAWKNSVSINSLVGPLVLDLSLDLKRTNVLVPAMQSTAAQNVAAIFNAGDLDYTGSATIAFDATNGPTLEGYFTAGTTVPLTFDINTTETNSHEVKFVSTNSLITMATIQRASANFVTLAIQFEGVANTTDVGTSAGRAPVKVTTKSQITSGTYA